MTKLRKNKFRILEPMHSIRCKHQNKPLITFCKLPSTSVGPRVGQRQKDQCLGVGQVEGAMDKRKEVHPMVVLLHIRGRMSVAKITLTEAWEGPMTVGGMGQDWLFLSF